MARNWGKFKLDELTHLWSLHKKKDFGSDPLQMRTVEHRKLELTKDELEELVDHLLKKLWHTKEVIDGNY